MPSAQRVGVAENWVQCRPTKNWGPNVSPDCEKPLKVRGPEKPHRHVGGGGGVGGGVGGWRGGGTVNSHL